MALVNVMFEIIFRQISPFVDVQQNIFETRDMRL